MILYVLYRIGVFLALFLPLKVSYLLASTIADIFYYTHKNDRVAVIGNMKIIVGYSAGDKELEIKAREVFRNFAKYLVDFFRFTLIDEQYIKRCIKVEGLENIDKALRRGKGAVVLSAHIGNWELGGLVLSLFRHPVVAVVLKHQNKRINDFFTRQRSIGSLKPVEIGISLRNCYDALKNNGLLAILGDRDFSNKGFVIEFFGKPTQVPKGPAVFSYRMGSCIVPTFMVRMEDDTFKFTFEPPIFPNTNEDEESEVKKLMKEYSFVIEAYVRKYPSQWYMFKNVWNNNHEKHLRPDTII